MASAVGIVVAAAAVLVVLPAALVLCGRWVFWPLVPRVGQTTLVDGTSFWGRIGRRVARTPVTLIACATVLLGGMALGLTQVETGLSTSEQFLDEPEAISAAERLAESFPAGASDPTVVVTARGPASRSPRPSPTSTTWSRARSPRRRRLEPGRRGAREPARAATPPRPTIGDVRAALDDFSETYVGGPEAESVDEADAAARDRGVVIPLVLGLVLLVLMGLLRSVVAPLILVATVVATYLAALGVSWWVFTGLLGFEAIDVGMPLLAFLFLVALGVDYNIFLVTRAAEEGREHGARDGMLRALTATGGVITSAGILLAAVFAVLGVLPLVVLAQLGVVICIGVLLDTLLVRTVVVPAIAVLLGDRFWWPRKLRDS